MQSVKEALGKGLEKELKRLGDLDDSRLTEEDYEEINRYREERDAVAHDPHSPLED